MSRPFSTCRSFCLLVLVGCWVASHGAQAAWRQVDQKALGLPGGFLLQKVSQPNGKGLLLATDAKGFLWQVEARQGRPWVAYTLNTPSEEALFPHQLLPMGAQAGGDWLLVGQEGGLYLASLSSLSVKITALRQTGRSRTLWVAPVSKKPGGSDFFLLAEEEDRLWLHQVTFRNKGVKYAASGVLPLQEQPLALVSSGRTAAGEERATLVQQQAGGATDLQHFALNEAGVYSLGKARLLSKGSFFQSILPCEGMAGAYLMTYSVEAQIRPFRAMLLGPSLKPLSGHSALALNTPHQPVRCRVGGMAASVLELVDETGVIRSFAEDPFVVTFRDRPLRGLPAPRQIGGAWYLPLRLLAGQTGVKIEKTPEGDLLLKLGQQTVRTTLKSQRVSVMGKPVALDQPLLLPQEDGSGWVDMRQLWRLLRVPSRFSPVGPQLHIRPGPRVTP